MADKKLRKKAENSWVDRAINAWRYRNYEEDMRKEKLKQDADRVIKEREAHEAWEKSVEKSGNLWGKQ